MAGLSIEDLGLSPEELADRVVERCVERLLSSVGLDEDGETHERPSALKQRLDERVRVRLDEAVVAIAGKNVLPHIPEYVENLCLQETNRWGEKTGQPVTFTEYLVQRAEAYLTEQVDFSGKAKGQDSYSWKGTQTRLTHIVHQHLHYSIETAMKQAVAEANKVIGVGLQEAVRLKLQEVVEKLQVNVSTGR